MQANVCGSFALVRPMILVGTRTVIVSSTNASLLSSSLGGNTLILPSNFWTAPATLRECARVTTCVHNEECEGTHSPCTARPGTVREKRHCSTPEVDRGLREA
jgi:hypothetical protein